jgi:hypothetical protein
VLAGEFGHHARLGAEHAVVAAPDEVLHLADLACGRAGDLPGADHMARVHQERRLRRVDGLPDLANRLGSPRTRPSMMRSRLPAGAVTSNANLAGRSDQACGLLSSDTHALAAQR